MKGSVSVAVTPGSGTVARVADTIFVCSELSDISELMSVLSEYESVKDRWSAVRRLALAVLELVGQPDSDVAPSYGLVVVSETVTTLILSGATRARIISSGVVTELLGGEALTWLEKQIEGFDSITLTLDGSIQRAYGDLIAGVVAGSGVALSPRSLTTDACQEGQDSLGEIQPAPEYDPETELAAASGGDEQSEDRGSDTHVSTHEPDNSLAILLASARGGERIENLLDAVETTPVEALPIGPTVNGLDDSILVEGIDCKNGHFNDPSARFCGQCGIGMSHVTRELKVGARPGLGHLILEDGSTFLLDQDYVIGRDPERDPDVSSGRARPLRLTDDVLASRRHAAVRLSGWNVTIEDLGSANGTEVCQAKDGPTVTLFGEQSAVIQSGARVSIGSSHLTFVLHNKI